MHIRLYQSMSKYEATSTVPIYSDMVHVEESRVVVVDGRWHTFKFQRNAPPPDADLDTKLLGN